MNRKHAAAATTAAAALAAFALPQAASAQVKLDLPGLVRGTVNASPGKVLTGDAQLLDAVKDVTCPSTQGIATGIGSILTGAEGAGVVGCVIGALDLQFATTSGGVERTAAAVVNVPTPLDVDGAPGADVVGTVKVLSLSKFELRIVRAPGVTKALPLRVEALIDSPLPGLLPRERINVGYDTRGARAPQTWNATATLPATTPGTTQLDVATTVTGAGDRIATLGGLFDGAARARTKPMGGALQYAPVPPTATVGLTLGPKMAVAAGASQPVGLTADAVLDAGDGTQEAHVELGPLPKALSVSFEEPGVDQRKVVYTAAAPVDFVKATYTERTKAGAVVTKVRANAEDLPTGMTVEQTSARSGTFTATGGTLGMVEAGFANGEPRLLSDDHPYANVVQDGTLRSFAGRIDALQRATVDATNGIQADLQLGSDTARKPLHANVDYDGKKIDATVSDLPRKIDFGFTPSTGAIDYDAFGETIQKIDVEATSDVPFVDRAKRIEGTIEQLPAEAHVKAVPGSNGVSLTTDQAIGKADVLLSSGPDGGLADGEIGADVVDTPEAFVAHARVEGLKAVTLDLVKPQGGGVDKLTGHLELASRPTVVRYDSAKLDVDAALSAVPDDVTLTFDKPTGKLSYQASAGIASIDADVSSPEPLFDRAKVIDARIEGLPQTVDVGFKPAAGEGIDVTTSSKVGMVQATITDGVTEAPALADGQAKVALVKTPEAFAIAARVFQVRGGKVVLNGKVVDARLQLDPLADGSRQDVEVDVDASIPEDAEPEPLDLDALIVDVPTDVTVKLDEQKLDYTASQPITRLDVDARHIPQGSPGDGLAGKPRNAFAVIHDVPARLEVFLKDIAVRPGAGSALGRIDVQLWNSGDPRGPLDEDGRNKVVFDKRDGTMHVQGRLMPGLKGLALTLPGGPAATSKTQVVADWNGNAAPLDIALDAGTGADPTDIDVVAEELHTHQDFTISEFGGLRIDWRADQPGTDVRLDVSTKDLGADLDATDLPTSAQLCAGGDQQCVSDVPRRFRVNDKWVTVPTNAAIHSSANGLISVSGWICLPPSNDEGDRQGDVYGSCLDRSASNRIEMTHVELQNTALGVFSGETLERNGDGDGPEENDLLKVYLLTDQQGVRIRRLDISNTLTDKQTTLIAGWREKDGVWRREGKPLASEGGQAFRWLADLTGIPNTESRIGRMVCDDLTVGVDLPILGKTDVIPNPGEAVLGDICV